MEIYLFDQLVTLSKRLQADNKRGLVLLKGDIAWASHVKSQWFDALAAERDHHLDFSFDADKKHLVFSEESHVSGDCVGKTYNHHLGTENQTVWFFDQGFNVDALAALSGTLCLGGILFVWLEDKHLLQSLFTNRFVNIAKQNRYCFTVSEKTKFVLPEALLTSDKLNVVEHDSASLPEHDLNYSVTCDQALAVKQIKQTLASRNYHHLVISADRGRGKSSSLAIACAELFKESSKPLDVVITAPHRQAVNIFFYHVTHLLTDIKRRDNTISYKEHRIRFMAIDALISEKPKVSLLFVDEAAGIPVYLLESLLEQHKCIVFSSTVHGYEGAGRGFTQKFLPQLEKHQTNHRTMELKTPIRWRDGDPLEQVIFDTCLLNAEFNSSYVLPQGSLLEHVTTRHVSQQCLADDEQLLAQVFAVLVTAHYQTKPSDLKLLLDNPQVELFVSFVDQHVVAVALCIKEGVSDLDLIKQIKSGKRRVRNQFTPQTLSQQCIVDNAFDYRYLRIVRVAVPPQLQSMGLGSNLLSYVENYARQANIDMLSTSFATNHAVTKFWIDTGFNAVRLGFTKDASSGEHSLLMLKGLTALSTQFSANCQQEFYHQFPIWLADEFKHLDLKLIALLLTFNPKANVPSMTDRQLQQVRAFSQNVNLYHQAVPSLQHWLLHELALQGQSLYEEYLVLIAKVLTKHTDQHLCTSFGFTGKKALYLALQNHVCNRLTQSQLT